MKNLAFQAVKAAFLFAFAWISFAHLVVFMGAKFWPETIVIFVFRLFVISYLVFTFPGVWKWIKTPLRPSRRILDSEAESQLEDWWKE